jgi:hypothetical protein
MTELHDLTLYRELHRRGQTNSVARNLVARIDLAIGELSLVLADIRRFHQHFTDHSINHSLRIIRNVGQFLKDKQIASSDTKAAVSSVDLYLLIGAALVHDIGMVIAESEIDDLVKKPAFHALALKWQQTPDDQDWYRRGIPRQLVAEYIRRNHADRSYRMVLDRKIIPSSLVSSAPGLGHWLGLIAAGHGMDMEKLCDKAMFPTFVEVALGGGLQEECNPRFVVLCLRLGDLLDINTSRVCPLLRHLSEPLNSVSASHWDQYGDIHVSIRPENDVTIRGTCPTQDAERVLREWVSWLERETGNSIQLQNTDEERYRLSLGRVNYAIKPAERNGRPIYEFLTYRFNLDERRIFERLFGRVLYGRPELAIRELLQNAVDAHRALVLYHLSKADDWPAQTETVKNARFLLERDARSGSMPIEISLLQAGAESTDELPRYWLNITDSGIGMSRDVILQYLLKVGRSRWTDDATADEIGIGSRAIGTFGIGFLSTLMLADRVVVDTRSCLPEEPGLCVTIYGWQGFAAACPSMRSSHGTTIRMLLKSEMAAKLTQFEELITECSKQAPLLEFPVFVSNNEKRVLLPQVVNKASKRQTSLPLGNDGSRLILRMRDANRLGTEWTSECGLSDMILTVCQDGISVSGMHGPSNNIATARVLNEMGVLMDLRGGSRARLDLSRNLVEGEAEAFWLSRLSVIWDSVAAVTPRDRIARMALTRLLEATIVQSDASPYYLVHGSRLTSDPQALNGCDEVSIIESDSIHRLRDINKRIVWLCPPAPYTLLSQLDENSIGEEFGYWYDDEMALEEASKIWWESDSYSDDTRKEGAGRREIHEVISETPPTRRFLGNMMSHWVSLSRQFPWVMRNDDGIVLLREPRNHARLVSDLLGFSLTNTWRVVFNIETGTSMIMPGHGFSDIIDIAFDGRMSYCDVLMALSFGTLIEGRQQPEATSAMQSRLREARREFFARQSSEEDDSEDEDKNDSSQGRTAQETEWRSVSALIYFPKEDTRYYRGLAKEFGLLENAPSWETFDSNRPKPTRRRRR